MLLKLTILTALASFALLAQNQAAKPEPVAATKITDAVTAVPAPKLDSTARLWRLLAVSQELQQQLDQSDVGKRLADTRAQLQAEQTRLAGICGASKGFTLGTDSDVKSATSGDVVCVKMPDPPKETKPETAKGK